MMKQPPKVDCIVLTWNKLEGTKKFFTSLLENTKTPCRVIVIDNGSEDQTPAFLETLQNNEYVSFEITLNDSNLGFVQGVNQGIQKSKAPFVCLLNNDLEMSQGWLDEMLQVMESDATIGVLNPNSNNLGTSVPKDQSVQSFAEKIRSMFSNQWMEMPFCIGFCMLIRREVIEKVGGLSEEFIPMFYEDTDYTLKAQRAGFLTGMAKGSYVYHQEHGSVNLLKKKKIDAIMAKSRDTFEKKWGRTLRIVRIVSEGEEKLQEALGEAVSLARAGNFVWLFIRGKKVRKEKIFSDFNIREHSGVHLQPFSNTLHLLWLILKKKKRYHVIYTENMFVSGFLTPFKYRVFDKVDLRKVEEEKKRGVS